MAKHVKSENLQGDLPHYHKSTTNNLKTKSRVKVKVNFRQNKIIIVWWLAFQFFSSCQVSEHPTPPTFHLASIPLQWLFWKDAQAWHLNTCPTALKSQNSILLHRFEAWSRKPPCQAPGLCSFLANPIEWQVDVPHTFVGFQCFGKGLTKTMAKHAKSENLQGDLPHYHKSTTNNLKPKSRVKVKVNFRQNKIMIVSWLVFQFFSSCQVSEHPPRSHFSSCFHPVAMTLLERCTGPTPEHLSNSTKVSKFHFTAPFRGLEPQTPRQAPGLCSFLANLIVCQADVRNGLVDFQCFGKGLTKTMANQEKPEKYSSYLLVGESESCRNAFPCHTSIFLPSNFQDSFGKIPMPHNCLTPLKPHNSQTPLVHHFTPSSFTISKPGATDPRPKHQALAPSVPILIYSKMMFVTILLTFNASARACGQKRLQTMWNLRTCKAICDTNIKPKSATKKLKSTNSWSKDREETWESQGESQLKNILIYIYSSYLLVGESESCRNAFPCHTSIFLPSNFQDSFGKIPMPHNCLTPLKPHNS